MLSAFLQTSIEQSLFFLIQNSILPWLTMEFWFWRVKQSTQIFEKNICLKAQSCHWSIITGVILYQYGSFFARCVYLLSTVTIPSDIHSAISTVCVRRKHFTLTVFWNCLFPKQILVKILRPQLHVIKTRKNNHQVNTSTKLK